MIPEHNGYRAEMSPEDAQVLLNHMKRRIRRRQNGRMTKADLANQLAEVEGELLYVIQEVIARALGTKQVVDSERRWTWLPDTTWGEIEL